MWNYQKNSLLVRILKFMEGFGVKDLKDRIKEISSDLDIKVF